MPIDTDKDMADFFNELEFLRRRTKELEALLAEKETLANALRESEERFRGLFEHSINGIMICELITDQQGNPVDFMHLQANPSMEKHIGLTLDNIIGKRALEMASAEEIVETLRVFGRVVETGTPGSLEQYYPAFDRIIYSEAYSLGGKLFAVTFSDVTEQRNAQKALFESEEQYRNLVEGTSDFIWEIDRDGVFTYANPKVIDLLGYRPEEVVGKPFYTFMSSSEAKRLIPMYEGYIVRQEPFARVEHEAFHKDGHLIILESSGSPKFDRSGKLVGFRGMIRDVTERKHIQDAMRESEERFRGLFENALFGIVICRLIRDEAGRAVDYLHLDVNPATQLHTGWDLELIKNKRALEIVKPEEITELLEMYDRTVTTGQPGRCEMYVPTYDRTLDIASFALGGDIFAATFFDITERKQAVDALEDQKRFLNSILDQNPLPMWVSDNKGTLEKVNPALKKFLNLSDEQLIGKYNVFEDPQVKEQGLLDSFRNTLEKGTVSDFAIKWSGEKIPHLDLKGSTTVDIEGILFPIINQAGDITNMVITYRDVSERKQAQQALLESEEQYRNLVEKTSDFIWEMDCEGVFTYANPKVLDVLGYKPDEIVGKPFYAFMSSSEAERLIPIYESYIVRQESFVRIEHEACHKDGRAVILEASGTPKFDRSGKLVGFRGMDRDITERKHVQAALAESELKYRTLVESINDWIWAIDRNFVYTYSSPQVKQLLGYEPDEVIGKTLFNFMSPDEKDRLYPLASEIMTSQKSVERLENINLHKDGHEVIIETSAVPIFDDDRKCVGYRGIDRDITERKKLELQMQHAQKLESLGVLAGGIAHDFNNLLMAIMGNADLALLENLPSAPDRQYLEEIKNAATRAAELTNQLLAYSGKSMFVVATHDLNQLVKEIASLLKVSISKKVELVYELAEKLPAVEIDASQIRQVVMNLIKNSSDAIGDKPGIIIIRTGYVYADQGYLSKAYFNEELPIGPYVFLEVADNGCGMDDTTTSKLFDPFFSTKEHGHGLGLASVLGIVRGHKGGINVYSEINKGTTFKILLPASSESVSQAISKETTEAGKWKEKTVLLVDDEESVREVSQKMLQRADMNVITARDGAEAVEVFRTKSDEIDLILMDMAMPGMSGDQAIKEIRKIRSDVTAILMSGYSEKDARKIFKEGELDGFIQKPFEWEKLISMIRAVFEKIEKSEK